VRPRHQAGAIVRKGSNWILRYYVDEFREGVVTRVRKSEVLAPYSLTYRNKSDVKDIAAKRLSEVVSHGSLDGALTLREFVENRYFPHIEKRMQMSGELHLEQSTVKGYKDIWKFHGKSRPIAEIHLREIKAAQTQQFLMSLDQSLSHRTHLRIKAFLSGVFSYAKQSGALTGVNAMDDTKVGGEKKKFQGVAYSLDTIKDMLERLPEPARTVCATAAFTGLSASELRGLRWQDYDGETLTVSQKVWRTHVGQPKTDARSGAVPVIPVLKKILEGYREKYPPKGEFIFRGEKRGFALNLDNLSRRVISPAIKDWSGWHGFRRGLGTRLFYLGTDAKTVQTILRHANVSTTMAHYILPDPEEAKSAMQKFNRVLDPKRSPSKSGGLGKKSKKPHKN
jgi:integrase